MKNYLIRRKIDLGLKTEHWLYVSSLGLQPDLPVTIREVPLARISEGIRTFETWHEAVSVVSKHLNDAWEVVNTFDVLLEAVKELNEAKA